MAAAGSYDPTTVEPRIYQFWEVGNHFHAAPDPDRKPYSIVIPPPNVTGALHLGHALNNTLQDILVRRARMLGYATCWLPGTDHAGIATQAVVEKRLREEEGQTRHEVGRDGLVQRIWAWKDDYNARILGQLKRLGCSCDWDRTRFTLDDVCAQAVYETFFRFFKDGLIFRGQRLVNWDTALQTAVADDEIVAEKVKGKLWTYRYPLAGKNATGPDAKLGEDYLVIATTRPETMLGDTAIAVHPNDPRYQHLVGQHAVVPLVEREIPIIADGLLVDPAFGTGCVKVTPGHDPNDYACGQRNNLAMLNILTLDGKINANGGPYSGLDRYAAREQIVHDLHELGLLEDEQPHEMNVGHSDRSKTPIEPLLSEQWFVQMEHLAESAMEAVRDHRVRFFPSRYAKTYLDWLGEKRDWCISRQLWWGHRIPVWYWPEVSSFTPMTADDCNQLEQWAESGCLNVHYEPRTESPFALIKAAIEGGTPDPTAGQTLLRMHFCPHPSITSEFEQLASRAGLEQDPDVLDTWFSSALWPHSTFGWPAPEESNPDLPYFYPTNVLCTARDIISLWVARMVMTGLYNMRRVPFPHVYIHPVIQDGQGRRMSKSLGNGVDPLDIIDLFGTDALRFTLAAMAGETQDMRIPVKSETLPDGRSVNSSERFETGRNFCNKLWQAATGFVLTNLDGYAPQPLDPQKLAVEDRWILSRLSITIDEVNRRLDRYQFNDATAALYAFFWNDFCDWYIEMVKPRLFERDAGDNLVNKTDPSARAAQQILAYVLDQALRLLHPTTPFITEELWRQLNQTAPSRGVRNPQPAEPALITANWPRHGEFARDPDFEREMDLLTNTIRALRDIRNRVNGLRAAAKETPIRTLPQAVVKTRSAIAERLARHTAVICRLAGVDALDVGPTAQKPPEAASAVLSEAEVYVSLTGLADLSIERERLNKELKETAGHIKRTRGKLANESFVAKAPPAVVEKERQRLTELEEKLTALERNLAELTN